jgi:hypothetical protein
VFAWVLRTQGPFNDIQLGEEQAAYLDNVTWPTTVWVRVFRFQNGPWPMQPAVGWGASQIGSEHH